MNVFKLLKKPTKNIFKQFNSRKLFSERLIDAIDSQITIKNNFIPLDNEEATSFYRNTNFKYIEKDNSRKLQLLKISDEFRIQVHYTARLNIVKNPELDDKLGNIVDLAILLSKPDSQEGLLIDAILLGRNIEINNIQFCENVKEVYEKHHTLQKFGELYTGPDYFNMNEVFQREMHLFLEKIGIDYDLVDFIQSTSVDKAERLYGKWLNKLKNFV